MLGAAVAYNLKKWLNYGEQKRKTAVVSMKKQEERPCFWLLLLIALPALATLGKGRFLVTGCKQKANSQNRLTPLFQKQLCNCHFC